GPFVIDGNYLEAASENILFGGADPAIVNLIPADITVTNNYVTKPLAWKGKGYNPKNLIEFKNAQRFQVHGNVFENSWVEAQAGFGVMVTVRDQSGKCPLCTVKDGEISGNVIRHVYQGIDILGLDDDKDSTGQ